MSGPTIVSAARATELLAAVSKDTSAVVDGLPWWVFPAEEPYGTLIIPGTDWRRVKASVPKFVEATGKSAELEIGPGNVCWVQVAELDGEEGFSARAWTTNNWPPLPGSPLLPVDALDEGAVQAVVVDVQLDAP